MANRANRGSAHTKAQLEVDLIPPFGLQAMVESRRSATNLARFDAFVDRAKFPA
jgi:hypothetical protein